MAGIDEDHYLDGPVTPRVAVSTWTRTRRSWSPARCSSRQRRNQHTRPVRRFAPTTSTHPQFIQVSVFATVLRTMYMYEESDTLGRRITWAFGGPQLLVIPRAGWWPNAYYERRSRSLQFFSFRARGKLVHTSLSRDIVAHETAHALIDGIDPGPRTTRSIPQSLALHEGIADLTAVLIAFRSGRLRKAVLDATNGSIEKSTRFSSIGEEFGRAIDPSGAVGCLRNLLDGSKLDPKADPADEPEEHVLSQVVTGALYTLMVDAASRLHDRGCRCAAGESKFAVSGRALFGASEQFKRMILRGIDYLPPGEVTFADYGRAIIAADQGSFGDDTWRQYIREEFVRRGIVRRARDLDVADELPARGARGARPAGAGRQPVGRPTRSPSRTDACCASRSDAQFEVLPRIVVNKRFLLPDQTMDQAAAAHEDTSADDDRAGRDRLETSTRLLPVKELLFKVRWSVTEDNPPDLGIGTTRRIQTGTTLVIDWDRRLIRSVPQPARPEASRSRPGTRCCAGSSIAACSRSAGRTIPRRDPADAGDRHRGGGGRRHAARAGHRPAPARCAGRRL